MIRAAILALLLAVHAAAAFAQSPGKVYRLGHLAQTAESEKWTRRLTLPELQRLGFVEGRNLVFDSRFGAEDEQPGLMRELLAAKPDAIIAVGPSVVHAHHATSTVPIVSFGANPVERGLATSLARPGGNVTGVMILTTELDTKRLQLLHEAAPNARSVAVLFQSSAPSRAEGEPAMRALAARAGIELSIFTVDTAEHYAAAFAAIRAAGAQALVISAHAQFGSDAPQLAALALEARLPTICEWAEMAQSGCLLGYGPSRPELRRRVADYVARIFRGAAPAEMPVEGPTIFEFAVNLRIAKTLGIDLPQALLARADEVIE